MSLQITYSGSKRYDAVFTFVHETKDLYEEKSEQRSCRRENGPGLRGSPVKSVQSRRKFLFVVFAKVAYKQPTTYRTWQVSLPATSTQARGL